MTLADRLRAIVDPLPPGSAVTLPADAIRGWLDEEPPAPVIDSARNETWRERIWTAPADTRLGVREVAEALGRPLSFVYRRTSMKAAAGSGKAGRLAMLPHRRLGGELVFLAGELRDWIRGNEQQLVPGPTRPARIVR